MTTANWFQLIVLIALVVVATPARPVHGQGVRPRRRQRAGRSVFSRSSGSSTASPASTRARAALEDLRRSRAGLQPRLVLFLYLLQRVQGVLPLNPTECPGAPGAVVQHRRQLRHQHQLAELRGGDHREPPHPDGRPDGAELRVGGGRPGRGRCPHPWPHPAPLGDDRQLLGRPHAGGDSHPAAHLVVVAVVFVSQGAIQNFDGFTEATTLEGATRSIPGGRSPARRPSRSWARTAAARSTPTPPPVREPERLHQPVPDVRILLIPFALTYTFGRLVRTRNRAGWSSRRCSSSGSAARLAMGCETGGNPRSPTPARPRR